MEYFHQSGRLEPEFHLALEEYLLKQGKDNYVLLYRNHPSVIIGKHQCAYAEINFGKLNLLQLPWMRRISGGGAVYHDEGNINLAFIGSVKSGSRPDFASYSRRLFEFVASLGLSVKVGVRDSLFVNDLKISGNAQHLSRGRFIYHATLLYDARLDAMEGLFHPDIKVHTRALPSYRSPVTNLKHMLPDISSIEGFLEILRAFIQNINPSPLPWQPNEDEGKDIGLLAKKYVDEEWNYGYSPDFDLIIHGKTVKAHRGRIMEGASHFEGHENLKGKLLLPEFISWIKD